MKRALGRLGKSVMNRKSEKKKHLTEGKKERAGDVYVKEKEKE